MAGKLWLIIIHEQGGGTATSGLYVVDQKKADTQFFMFWAISRGSAI